MVDKSHVTQRQRIFSTCWVVWHVLAFVSAALDAAVHGVAYLGVVSATAILVLGIPFALGFVPQINRASAVSVMHESYPFIVWVYVAYTASWRSGWLSLTALVYPLILGLFFVYNQRFIDWLASPTLPTSREPRGSSRQRR